MEEIFQTILSMSDQRVDPRLKRRLSALLGRPASDVKDELLGLIDDTVMYGWAASLVIRAMDMAWRMCGGTSEELQGRSTADTPENRARYKWER